MGFSRGLYPLLILLIGVFPSGHGDPKLIENGYDDVIIEIEKTVPENDCSSIFHGIEDIFTRASLLLYRATNRRSFFRSISVVVPKSWSGAQCPSDLNTVAPQRSSPSVTVGMPHPIFMHTPWTLQEKGCGAPGHRIYMTPEFLRSRTNSTVLGDPGRLLVHEWAKFRWGVFEEYGHEGDPIYPSFKRTDIHSYTPTGCSNVKVQGITKSCEHGNNSCRRFIPDEHKNDAVTSSLMYLHYLPHVTKFCDAHTHNARAPTKQNTLCGGRSVWEVMRGHPDFLNSSGAGDPVRNVTPSFRYVKPSVRRYVIVIEDTTIMNVQKRWDFLRKAIRKLLVYDLPAGHEVGVVLFDQIAYVKLPMTPIPDTLEQRQRLATASLPRNPSQVAPSQKCVLCGLEEAVQMLSQDSGSSSGGVIFLISSGTPIPTSVHDVGQLERVVKEGHVQVVPIMYPVTNRNPQPKPGVEQLAEISGTRSFVVIDDGIGSDSKVAMMVSLMNAIYSALRDFLPSPVDLPLLVHQQEFPGGISSTSQGSFDIDESLGETVTLSLTYYDLGHVGNTINLIDPNGDVLDSYNMQEEDGDVNMIFVTIRNAMVGTWSYRVENRADSHQSLFIQVLSTPSTLAEVSSTSHLRGMNFGSPQSPPEAVALKAWTSSKRSLLNVSDSSSVFTVYAQLWAGLSPVVGADVEVVLQRLGLNDTRVPFRPERFKLYDNGNGDADLTKNDGIYSRHLPLLHDTPARYTLKVVARNGHESAAIVLPAMPERPPWNGHLPVYHSRNKRALGHGMSGPHCCGSVIRFGSSVKAGRFSRSISIGMLDVVGNHALGQSILPSRVGDLRATVDPASVNPNYVTFSWTAPGNKRDHGLALRYDVVVSHDYLAISKGIGERIKQWSKPRAAGHQSEHIIRWQRHDALYFVAMRTVGRDNQTSPWSNVVAVYVPPPPTTTEINTRDSTVSGTVGESIGELSPPARSRSLLSNRDILAIVGAACGLLLIILVLAVYYMVVVSRRRDRKEKIVKEVIDVNGLPPSSPEKNEDETDSINKQSPEAMVMSETSGGVQRPLSPMQSWTASRLLAEHERRRSTDPSFGDTPDINGPYNQCPPFYYHTPNGHYIEDTIPIDSGSLVSTHPSESPLVYKLDTSTAESLQASTSPLGTTPLSWDLPSAHPPKRGKVPPPTLPKPTVTPFDLCTSATLGLERRRRNVTQV